MSSFGLQSLSSEMTHQNAGKDFILWLTVQAYEIIPTNQKFQNCVPKV